jgi:hypothetical protein
MIFNYSKGSFLKEHETGESYVIGASCCHVLVTIRGFGVIIGYFEHLQLVTTSNYKAVANSCARLLITALLNLLCVLFLHR